MPEDAPVMTIVLPSSRLPMAEAIVLLTISRENNGFVVLKGALGENILDGRTV